MYVHALEYIFAHMWDFVNNSFKMHFTVWELVKSRGAAKAPHCHNYAYSYTYGQMDFWATQPLAKIF